MGRWDGLAIDIPPAPFKGGDVTVSRMGEVTGVTVPGAKAPFQLLDHHAPIISILTSGEIKLYEGKKELKSIAITGGTIEFNNNKAVILVE